MNPSAIQAYIQTTLEKNFLNIWEKLGKLENSHNKQIDYDQQNNQDTASLTKKTPPNNQAQHFTNQYGQITRHNNSLIDTMCSNNHETTAIGRGKIMQHSKHDSKSEIIKHHTNQ